jgi:type I restriction enzyme M protein
MTAPFTPGRYVGAVVEDEDDEPFEGKMRCLTAQIRDQMAEARRLEDEIQRNLQELGYGL